MDYYLVLPFVVALIEGERGGVLIGQHPYLPTKPYPGFWDLPGGKLEPDETPEQCIWREIQEELGVEPMALALYGVYHHDRSHFLTGMRNMIPGLAIAYRVTISGPITPTEQMNVHYAFREELIRIGPTSTPWMRFFLKDMLK